MKVHGAGRFSGLTLRVHGGVIAGISWPQQVSESPSAPVPPKQHFPSVENAWEAGYREGLADVHSSRWKAMDRASGEEILSWLKGWREGQKDRKRLQ